MLHMEQKPPQSQIYCCLARSATAVRKKNPLHEPAQRKRHSVRQEDEKKAKNATGRMCSAALSTQPKPPRLIKCTHSAQEGAWGVNLAATCPRVIDDRLRTPLVTRQAAWEGRGRGRRKKGVSNECAY